MPLSADGPPDGPANGGEAAWDLGQRAACNYHTFNASLERRSVGLQRQQVKRRFPRRAAPGRVAGSSVQVSKMLTQVTMAGI